MTSLGCALLCSKGSPIGNIYMGRHISFKKIEPYHLNLQFGDEI
jgi:hypothetical protein